MRAWQSLFLENAKLYLEGSKAPDKEFKDFKNHVLHMRDDYWGGAPEKVRSWYQHLVEALARQGLADGGLLRRRAQPLLHRSAACPFTPRQSEAENNIHRAAEWSISKRYDELSRKREREVRAASKSRAVRRANWLATLVCRSAETANGYYEKLIAHYDIQRGVVDPPAGLDQVAQRIIAELLRYATISSLPCSTGHRGSACACRPVSGCRATLLATARVPFKAVRAAHRRREERRQVERIYDELITTGTVNTNLSEDDRTVRDLHMPEALSKLPPKAEPNKVFPFKPRERTARPVERPAPAVTTSNVVSLPQRVVAPAAVGAIDALARPAATSAAAPLYEHPAVEEATVSFRPKAGLTTGSTRVTVAPLKPRERKAAAASVAAEPAAGQRFYLTPEHDVVDGPSIGPKTAERLHPHGVKTVRDLLKADPAALSVLIDTRGVTAETIAAWQDQARLVCTVPGLRGTHAQLLVGAGYATGAAIADAEPEKLCADVLSYAASTAGQRLLRNGDPPDIEKIKGWLEAAQSVRAA